MPNELSGGEQQRVSIARSLIDNPRIILMDEPFSSLDPTLRKQMGEWLKSIQESLNLTILFVTHDVTEALSLSDNMAFLSEGSLIQIGTPTEMYNKPMNMEVGGFLGPYNLIKVEESTLFVRPPHQLSIDLTDHSYQVVSMRLVGKECRIELQKGNELVRVEVYEPIELKKRMIKWVSRSI